MSNDDYLDGLNKVEKTNVVNVLGNYKIQIKIHKTIILLLSIFCVALVLSCLYLNSVPKQIPWVIELTTEGEERYRENEIYALTGWTPEDATQRYFMTQFIQDLRTVSVDNYQNQKAGKNLYARSIGNALNQIKPMYSNITTKLDPSSPFARMKTEYVIIPVEEISVVRYASNQWKVVWREQTKRRTDQQIIRDEEYEGIFTVGFYKVETDYQKKYNPIGMYITDYEIKYLRNLIRY